MVELETLAAFDLFQWLRTGHRAAAQLGCNQSTVSRATRRCQELFGVRLERREAEWVVCGDAELLLAERRVHQVHRWGGGRPLRLDAQAWLRESYAALCLPRWSLGNLNYLEYDRPCALLRQRVIDAWLCSAPDLPRDPELAAIQLCAMPTLLMARRDHPLFARGAALTIAEAAAYPVLPLPSGAFPVFMERFSALGFSMAGRLIETQLQDPQAEAREDLFLGIASPLTLAQYEADWCPLPLQLDLPVGDAVVVRREFAGHPRTLDLVQRLSAHLRQLCRDRDDVELLDPSPAGRPDRASERPSERPSNRSSGRPAPAVAGDTSALS